jgi:hypothetical protein
MAKEIQPRSPVCHSDATNVMLAGIKADLEVIDLLVGAYLLDDDEFRSTFERVEQIFVAVNELRVGLEVSMFSRVTDEEFGEEDDE